MLSFEKRVLCGNPLQRFGSGLEPDPEPTWKFEQVANTSIQMQLDAGRIGRRVYGIIRTGANDE
jgi:hypothetical protein